MCYPQRHPDWWIVAAQDAVEAGHFTVIPGRNDTDAYVARYWLTPPVADTDGYASSDSTYLHQFLRGDDDAALHDHPGGFDSTILVGGYTELVPPWHWVPGSKLGPFMNECELKVHQAGSRIKKAYGQLHSVKEVIRGTWTLVTTGPKEGPWGFHPGGEPWIAWREFVKHAPLVGKPTGTT
jgi:hypothetical protein